MIIFIGWALLGFSSFTTLINIGMLFTHKDEKEGDHVQYYLAGMVNSFIMIGAVFLLFGV